MSKYSLTVMTRALHQFTLLHSPDKELYRRFLEVAQKEEREHEAETDKVNNEALEMLHEEDY